MSSEAKDFLLNQIRRRKYRSSDPAVVIKGLFKEVKAETNRLASFCWEIVVELLAHWVVRHEDLEMMEIGDIKPFHGLTDQYLPLYKKINKTGFIENYCTAAKEQPWDYIGELYQELGLVGEGQNMTPKNVVDMMLQMTLGEPWKFDAKQFVHYSYVSYLAWYTSFYKSAPRHVEPVEFPMQTQLDPAVGTGRFLLEASRLYPDAPLVQYGVEINLGLYRACLVNMAMFSKHPFSIICADSLRLRQDKSGPNSPLWSLGNRWHPPDVSDYYYGPTQHTLDGRMPTTRNKTIKPVVSEDDDTKQTTLF